MAYYRFFYKEGDLYYKSPEQGLSTDENEKPVYSKVQTFTREDIKKLSAEGHKVIVIRRASE
jgi:hypothetical protein